MNAAATRGLRTASVVGSVLLVAAGLVARRPPAGVGGMQGMAMASAATPDAAPTGRPATTVRPLSCTPLPDVPGKSLTTMLVEFPPLAYTPAHRHPGSVSAVVVAGTVRSQMAGGPAQDYAKGQTWFEAPRALHVFAENPSGTESAMLLVTFIADEGCTGLVIPEHLG